MSKFRTKDELVLAIQVEHRRLEKNLAALNAQDRTKPGVVGTWSVKDLLAHLTAWEQLLLDWYADGLHDKTPAIAPVGMSRNAMHALNQNIYTRNRKRSLKHIQVEFHASYRRTLSVVEKIREQDMFLPNRFAWTGKLRLADYIAGNTCNHYRWANAQLCQWRKRRANAEEKTT